ncbi:unnamed protein product [Acanthoscelides obtectus]|uniref:MADF domain-containing protein n=1 Tax=Acanthoscelides obtectus TaxID=200917 RepID=A0A9P0M0C0_ACAOB|nr:unnamed protein product [Acanthoscelides obtectus]CAK1680474.1 hypothetical protein AOBTE_LOCUS32683 [Acanthoscelides obtectus]
MSGWSNEESLSFLEYYQTETCIWNPKDVNHKDKKKVADAWSRLAQLMGKPVKELKSKKEILMTTFRKHLKKKQDFTLSGAGGEDIYKPTWFAYEMMESFLLPVYTCIDGINTETQSQQNVVHEEREETEDDHTDTITTPSRPSTSTNKRRRPITETAEKQMATAFEQLTNDIRQRRSECRPAHEDDDCDLYAKLLAIKLRELPNERKLIMYQIDGLFISRINQRSYERHTTSPQYYSRPSSMATIYEQHTPSTQFQDIPSRPTSVNTIYSEPIPNTQRFFPSTQTSHSEPFSNIIIEHRSRPTARSPSEAPSQLINIISDQIIQPAPPERNIINEALLKTFEDFQSSG